MKTKSLMTAGALAVLMAACTNDELELNNVQSNAERPSAGKVVLTLNPTGDSETRATWTGSGWTFNEEGDRFGALLMDTWNGTGNKIGDFTLVDHVHSNYAFKSEDGGVNWVPDGNFVPLVGNYFFVYPYDAAHNGRNTVKFGVPAVQQVYDENGVDAVLPVKFYQEYLGYAFLPENAGGVTDLAPSFYPLFANPKFKIKNESGADLKVFKVLIRTHQEGLADSPMLMPTTTALLPKTSGFATVNWKYEDMEQDQQLASLFSHATTPLDGFFGTETEKGVYEYVIDCGDNYVVGNREYVRVSAVMPAGEYHNFDVYLFVEDKVGDRGVVRLNDVAEAHWTNMDTENGSMQTVLKPGITQIYTAAFGNNAIENLGIKDFTVVNSEDFCFVADLKAKDGGRDLVTIKTLGDQVVLDEDVYALISAVDRKGIKWQIDGTIVIPEDAAADAIDQLTTGESNVTTTIVNFGKQVLTKDLNNVVVINSGRASMTGNVDIYGDVINRGEMAVNNIYGDVENYGTLTVKTVDGDGELSHEGKPVDVLNYGTLTATTVKGNMWNVAGTATVNTVEGALRNYGTVTVNNVPAFSNKWSGTMNFAGGEAGKTGATNRGGIVNVIGATKFNYFFNDGGTLNINANTTITGLAENGTAEHNGAATINVKEGMQLSAPTGKIRNLANATINVSGKLVDNIYNSGLINVIGNGLVIVNNKVDAVSTNVTWKDASKNLAEGIIDVTAAYAGTDAQAAKCLDSENMFFRYTVNKDKAKDLEAELKTRISSNNYGKNPIILVWAANSPATFQGVDLSSKNANVTNVVIDNDLTLVAATRMTEAEYITINAGKTLTIGNGATTEGFNLGSAEVTINGTVKVNNHAVVAGAAKYVGNGSIYNAGSSFAWTAGADWTGNVY